MIFAQCRNTVNPLLFPQGATVLRLWDGGTRMALVNPAAGQFVWDRMDAHLAASEAAGLKTIYTFGSTPAWAAMPVPGQQAGIIDPTSNSPMQSAALAAFVDALMARYGARLWAIETWNEWNAPAFWAGSLTQLAVMHYIIYSRVKRASPAVLVATPTPCLAPKCQYPTADLAMDAFLQMGFPFDVVSFHGYVTPGLAPASQITATIAALRSVMSAHGTTAPLWDTEFGSGTFTFPTTDAQRLWVYDSLFARHAAALDLACWYQWDNQTHGTLCDLTGALTVQGQAFMGFVNAVRA